MYVGRHANSRRKRKRNLQRARFHILASSLTGYIEQRTAIQPYGARKIEEVAVALYTWCKSWIYGELEVVVLFNTNSGIFVGVAVGISQILCHFFYFFVFIASKKIDC